LASDIYFGPTSAGSNNGTSCTDRYAYNDATHGINGTANPGPWVAGNTLHLCGGTWTGTAGHRWIYSRGSGSSGNPITIKFETDAILNAPYHYEYGGIYLANNYIIVDGGTNGIIQNTDNGTGLTYQHTTAGIYLYPCNNCEVKNLTIRNLYIHAKCELGPGLCDLAASIGGENALYITGSNISIHDNVMHDGCWLIFTYPGASNDNLKIYNNEFYNMDHGIACGAPASKMFFYNNHFHDMDNWDTGTDNKYHHDAIHCYGDNVNTIGDLYIYNNLFDGNQGDCCVTAQIYLEQNIVDHAHIWNNVIIGSLDGLGYGQVILGGGISHEVYNNTIIGTNTGANGVCLNFTPNSPAATVKNNIIENCNQPLKGASGATIAAVDYNMYANTGGGNPVFQFGGISTSTWSTWQSNCGCDSHSHYQAGSSWANLSSEGVPSAGFAGITAGVNLTIIAIGNLASLSSDTGAGNTRTPVARPGGTTAWDVGAYKFVSGAPMPPTNLTVTSVH
jgi:hypothetical protein